MTLLYRGPKNAAELTVYVNSHPNGRRAHTLGDAWPRKVWAEIYEPARSKIVDAAQWTGNARHLGDAGAHWYAAEVLKAARSPDGLFTWVMFQ